MITATNMAGATFHNVFERWISEQSQFLQLLVSISKNHPTHDGCATNQAADLVNRVVHHYEEYYRAKTHFAREDVFAMLTPSWRSSLEDAFLWIGGWRPTMAFHLLYSKSGLQFEAQFEQLVRGLSSGDLGDLSQEQMAGIDELQKKVVRKEREITEKLAKQQDTVADTSMVELSHVVSTMLQGGGDLPAEEEEEQLQSTLAEKRKGLEGVLKMADDLRLAVLKGVVNILNPIQAVHFLIAAAELHLRLHDWGTRRDAAASTEIHNNNEALRRESGTHVSVSHRRPQR